MSDDSRFADLTLLQRQQTQYPDSPEQARLETFENRYRRRDYWVTFECPEYTSLCPVTNQPDYGSINIHYVPDERCIESKSLKLYLFSFRNVNTFHEEAVNRILDDVVAACRPRRCRVTGCFAPRGGISIEVSAEHGGDE